MSILIFLLVWQCASHKWLNIYNNVRKYLYYLHFVTFHLAFSRTARFIYPRIKPFFEQVQSYNFRSWDGQDHSNPRATSAYYFGFRIGAEICVLFVALASFFTYSRFSRSTTQRHEKRWKARSFMAISARQWMHDGFEKTDNTETDENKNKKNQKKKT